MSDDTISIDSVQKLNYDEIAFDDYVNIKGEVVLAEIRPINEYDKMIRKKMTTVSGVDNLDGQLKTIDFYSNSLGQLRELTLYTPKNYTTNNIIYLTDGSMVGNIARELHPMIINNDIQPVQLIGIHSDYEFRFKNT